MEGWSQAHLLASCCFRKLEPVCQRGDVCTGVQVLAGTQGGSWILAAGAQLVAPGIGIENETQVLLKSWRHSLDSSLWPHAQLLKLCNGI